MFYDQAAAAIDAAHLSKLDHLSRAIWQSHAAGALLDDQELDSRGSTGGVYWEGVSDLLDAQGRRVGRGYLEMTGYAAPLKL